MELTKEQKFAQRIIAEAWDNPLFKKELIASPFEAIEKLTGVAIKLPDGVERLEVVDQSDTTCSYFNIPAPPNMDDVELTDEQLEVIAGGNGNPPPPPPGIFELDV